MCIITRTSHWLVVNISVPTPVGTMTTGVSLPSGQKVMAVDGGFGLTK
jgi:hypothetical protein